MKNILVIAKNTFRETIRDKILYGIVAFSIIFIILDLFLARVSLGDLAMIKSFGLAGIYIFGAITTIFLGASIIHKEIERRTLYFIISKPVSRLDVILGKFLGLFSAVALTNIIMGLVYTGVIFYESQTIDYLGLLAVLFQIFEMGLFTAMLIFFSSIAAPLTSTISATIILFIGHLSEAMFKNVEQAGGITYGFGKFIYYIFPNLEKFNLRNLVVHNISISLNEALLTLGYALIYSITLLYLANVFFKRKEL